MVKLPDAGSVFGTNGPNIRGDRPTAHVDPSGITEGTERLARSLDAGGQAMARAIGDGGVALGRAIAAEAIVGRAVTMGGEEIARAIEEGGARVGRAISSGGAAEGAAVQEGGSRVARAYESGGAQLGNAVSEGASRIGRTYEQSGGELGRTVARSGGAFGDTIESTGVKVGSGIRLAGEATGTAVEKGGAAIAAAIASGGKAQAAASEKLHEGLGKLGDGIMHLGIAEAKLELSSSRSQFLVGKKFLDTQFDKDTDYATLPERYAEALAKLREETASGISSSMVRGQFMQATDVVAADGVSSAIRQANKLQTSDVLAKLQGTLSDLSDRAQTAHDDERGGIITQAVDLIDDHVGAGYLDPGKARLLKREWSEGYGKAWIQGQPIGRQVELLNAGPANEQHIADRVIQVESGGDAKAQNQNSSARGLGQFTKATWLDLIKAEKPELAQGRSDAELLALRDDPKLSREMVVANIRRNSQVLTDNGIEASPANVYLAHFLGPAGAVKLLKAQADTPVSEVLDPAAIAANPSVLGGKTVGGVAAWAGQKMGGVGQTGTPVDFIPVADRMRLRQHAEQTQMQQITKTAAARGEEYELQIINAAAGKGDLPKRSDIENDPSLTAAKRNTVLRQHDNAAGDIATFQNAMNKFLNHEGGPFNPFDKTDAENVDKIFTTLGGDKAALEVVVDRTGMLPKTVSTTLRGDLISGDAGRVQSALTLSNNLLMKNDNIFVHTDGQKDIQKATIEYRHYIDDLGYSAEQATRKYMEGQSPEYQSKINARIKAENVDELIKKNLSVSDLKSAFNTSILPYGFRPDVASSPEARDRMFADYAELTKERYLERGDWGVAKAQAQAQLKKVWGTSSVNGSNTLMPYPPEQAPALAGIPNASDHIGMQAVEAIRAETGQSIDRKKITLWPNEQTPGAYKAGLPPPYSVSWQDDKGVMHFLDPGRAFVPDPRAMTDAASAERLSQFNAARAQADAGQAWQARAGETNRAEASVTRRDNASKPTASSMTAAPSRFPVAKNNADHRSCHPAS
jgi:hypothetical protein